jgi:hypothetical protein
VKRNPGQARGSTPDFAWLNPGYLLCFDSCRNARTLNILAEHLQIMAAVSQFPARESNKEREMILCQIKEMEWPAGIP